MTLNRRTALGLAAVAAIPRAPTRQAAPADPTEIIRLWPGAAPGETTSRSRRRSPSAIRWSGWSGRGAR